MESLNAFQNTTLGILAGCTEICMNQPMLYWKNASQQKLPFTLNPRYLYRGIGASMLNMASLTAIQFLFTGKIRSLLLKGENRELTSQESLFAAFGGGAISGIACAPLELVMIQQQRFGLNIIQTPFKIIRDFGLTNGIMRGLWTSIGRESIFTAGYLGLAPDLTQYLVASDTFNGVPKPILNFAACMIASFIASGLTHPLDTIKTCMQGDLNGELYPTIRTSFNEIYSQGGITRFYNGFGWRYTRMALSFVVLDYAKTLWAKFLYDTGVPQPISIPIEEREYQV